MPTVQEMLSVENWAARQARTGLPSGLKLLDSLTGGLHPGELWLVLGTPGVGRIVLAGQIALQAALERQGTVVFLSGREPSEVILANIVCALGGVQAQHLKTGSLDTEDLARVAAVSERLSSTSLRFWSMADDTWETSHSKATPGLAHQIGRHLARLLVVDDIDTLLDEPILAVLPRLRQWCRTAQFSLVATLPEELVIKQGHLLPEVRRGVDVALRLSRDDQFDLNSPRAGEADLHVLRDRTGPIDEIVLAFQGHCCRFADFWYG